MRIIKRIIFINGVGYDIWLGLVNKSYGRKADFQLYYYVGDPDDPFHSPQSLKNGFKTEREAIEYGKTFMKTLLQDALNRQARIDSTELEA